MKLVIYRIHLNRLYVYVQIQKKDPEESFIKFLDVFESFKLDSENKKSTDEELRATGFRIGKMVINAVQDLTLDLNEFVGMGTNTCSVNTSALFGSVTTILNEAPSACYILCYN